VYHIGMFIAYMLDSLIDAEASFLKGLTDPVNIQLKWFEFTICSHVQNGHILLSKYI